MHRALCLQVDCRRTKRLYPYHSPFMIHFDGAQDEIGL